MLYKKNKSKELDSKLFKNPTAEYRGTPFGLGTASWTRTIWVGRLNT